MKRTIVTTLFIGMLTFAANHAAHAQVWIKVRPSPPVEVVVPGPPPSPMHVWVEPEWVWRRDAYVYVPGHWIVPRRPHAVWVPGHWAESPRGFRWRPGHWR